ncbi:MAG: hypothetical protein GYB51_20355 [Rhodobacteraceae bacterium]|jgi:hypothetical protein|nr:hypothetical protein [Paracoccaceae bacterium]
MQDQSEPKTRVFLIGFNRCATTSFHRFFNANGLKSVHWDSGRLAKRFYANIGADVPLFKDYPEVTVFSDMIYLSETTFIEPFKEFERIDRAYPGSLFILNTRNCDKWISSRVQHPRMIERCMSIYGVETAEEVIYRWRLEWHEHHAAALRHFMHRPDDLLVYNIETDTPDKLGAFLEPKFGKLDIEAFGHHNGRGKYERMAKSKEAAAS